jgi:hypothetical protein
LIDAPGILIFANYIFLIENLLFSDKVKKINLYGWNQERILVISSEKIYNIKKNKVKRKIEIAALGGVSKTMLGSKTEFTMHVPKAYDYRFLSEK